MVNLTPALATELRLQPWQIDNALQLLSQGATIPFIARYRKEYTGEMDETQLRTLHDRHQYLTELHDRKTTILKAIADQNKLTPALEQAILQCQQKTELEDLYLPYRPKRRTRATLAREKGLEPLAQTLSQLNQKHPPQTLSTPGDLEVLAQAYINPELGVTQPQEALQGAADILAETIAENAALRSQIRALMERSGQLRSRIKATFPEGSTKFELYRNYTVSLKKIAPHNFLAVLRGQREEILDFALEFDEPQALATLESQVIQTGQPVLKSFYKTLIGDAFQRLMKPSLTNGIWADYKDWADGESIQTFEANLRELLLAAPAGMQPTLAIDPGLRTGCKVAVIDPTGKFLHYQAIFPHQSQGQRQQAAQTLSQLIQTYGIALIAIGNGTAGRETDRFVAEVLEGLPQDHRPIKVMVSEAGASVYSASEVAIAEFPHLDVTVRGAISIGRRLQDPLAELVKIDPKSIGVGQYQHDVDQKKLKQKLEETVESCVNYVGVDLNTASKELLTYVSGLNAGVAGNIIAYRNENGAFRNRKSLLKVPKLGPKAFEQCAGFLRIRDGDNALDNTGVHPERYPLVEQMLRDLGLDLRTSATPQTVLKNLNLQGLSLDRYTSDTVGEPTLRDIVAELEKPGRDPRAQFTYAAFRAEVQTLGDLQVGMELEGVITNVANFGAFVDIGVHQDGLIHVSQMGDRFISDPRSVVKVGQVVKVWVLEVNPTLKRISLSLKSPQGSAATQPHPSPSTPAQSPRSKPMPKRKRS